jgi:hypothetical protein
MTATRLWMLSWSTITIRGCIGEDRSKEKARAKIVENELRVLSLLRSRL